MSDEDPQKPKPRKPIAEALAEIRAEGGGGGGPRKPIADALAEIRGAPAKPTHEPSIGEKISGTIGSLFPIGSAGERAQAGVRWVGSRLPFLEKRTGGPQTYEQALADIQYAKRQAPAAARGTAGLIGDVATAYALPGGWVLKAIEQGTLEGLFQSDPNKTPEQRLVEAAARSGLNLAGGKVLEGLSTGGRALGARVFGGATREAAERTASHAAAQAAEEAAVHAARGGVGVARGAAKAAAETSGRELMTARGAAKAAADAAKEAERVSGASFKGGRVSPIAAGRASMAAEQTAADAAQRVGAAEAGVSASERLGAHQIGAAEAGLSAAEQRATEGAARRAAELAPLDVVRQALRGTPAERKAAIEAMRRFTPAQARMARTAYLDEAAGNIGRSILPNKFEAGGLAAAAAALPMITGKMSLATEGGLMAARLANSLSRASGPLSALDQAAGGTQLQELAKLLGISLASPAGQMLTQPQSP